MKQEGRPRGREINPYITDGVGKSRPNNGNGNNPVDSIKKTREMSISAKKHANYKIKP